MRPIMGVEALEAFIGREFPQVHQDGRALTVRAVRPGGATMELDAGERHLRPGGTVSGPALFTLADVAAYVAILAHIGPVALAVTTNLSISFLRKAGPGRVTAEATILKLGRQLATVAVSIEGPDGALAAHAVATYSIPPH